MSAPPTLAPRRVPAVKWRGKGGQLPRLDDLPIPADVRPGQGWTGQMHEMAAHIGPHATLALIAAHGGEKVRVPIAAERSPFADVLGPADCATVAQVYGGNELQLPVARFAVARARRGVVIAAVRAGKITIGQAHKIIGSSRTYVSHLVNHTDEGRKGSAKDAATALPPQGDLFALLTSSATPRQDQDAAEISSATTGM